ncbi:hypothetical protein [Streptomyces niveiscabiei]|uniref:Integral membrane protein n=1 Tax=Streptomyces niveiscabiei TaxID=164115 RepID=A0ABW9I674_9ACTN
MFTQVGQTVRYAIADESRTARLNSLITRTGVVIAIVAVTGYYIPFVR